LSNSTINGSTNTSATTNKTKRVWKWSIYS
jgi:hypothetical protein